MQAWHAFDAVFAKLGTNPALCVVAIGEDLPSDSSVAVEVAHAISALYAPAMAFDLTSDDENVRASAYANVRKFLLCPLLLEPTVLGDSWSWCMHA